MFEWGGIGTVREGKRVRLYEYEGKDLFRDFGIPVPRGERAETPEAAEQIAAGLGCPVVVKAQVLSGGRGLEGGVLGAETPDEAGRIARDLLGKEIRGSRPDGVLVEERLSIEQEVYIGITIDGATGRPVAVVSGEGGVNIERAAAERPEAIARATVDPLKGLSGAKALDLARAAGLERPDEAARILERLARLFAEREALVAEINPLAVTRDGAMVAADARAEVDDAGLFRQPELERLRAARRADAKGERARAHGMTYVELDGDLGLICSGAGLGMATMDLMAEQGHPANFLETGGGVSRELMAEAMRLVLDRPGIRGVLINVYGGINPIHEGALGVADVMAEGVSVPVVAKALGNRQEETWRILEAAGVNVVRTMQTEAAVSELMRLVGKRTPTSAAGA